MDLKSKLRNWYNSGKDYAQGAAIYTEHGDNPTLKRLFAEKETPYKKEKLSAVLDELYNQQSSKPAGFFRPSVSAYENDIREMQATRQVRSRQISSDELYELTTRIPRENDGADSDELLRLDQTSKNLYKGMMDRIARVGETASEAKRTGDARLKDKAALLAREILEIDEKLEQIYSDRDFYFKNNRLPEVEKELCEISADPKLWLRKLESAKRQAREYRNKVAKYPDNEKYKATLEKHLYAIQQYTQLLNSQQ